MIQLLTQMMEFLEETAIDVSPQSRIKRQKRFLKNSSFWEEDRQHMLEDKFIKFYRHSKSVLEMIYPKILKTSIVGDTIHASMHRSSTKKLALRLYVTWQLVTTSLHWHTSLEIQFIFHCVLIDYAIRIGVCND